MRSSGWPVHVAGAMALAAYVVLAVKAEVPEARPWLGGGLIVGWVALAIVVWRKRDEPGARMAVVVWALAFRAVGVVTEPSWEDDYHRYLWDGYTTLQTGNPYAEAPSAAFGRGDDLPPQIERALDGINHPDLPTIYGPVSQLVFAAAATIGAGSFIWLKVILVGLEILGWWSLRAGLGWRGWVLVWWCPLMVTEVAFAGHPEAIGVALTALALAAWKASRGGATALAVALATAVKPFGALLGPFVVARFGWRVALLGLTAWGLCYLPWWWQGSWAEWPVVRLMSQTFEYNSTAYALLSLVSPTVARGAGLLVVGLTGIILAWRWWSVDRTALPPVAPVLGVALLFSPVVNPWYALWLLPWLGLKSSGWGVGVLLAVPLAYTHGWGLAVGAGVDYTHPWWTRPLELVVVATAALGAEVVRRRRTRS